MCGWVRMAGAVRDVYDKCGDGCAGAVTLAGGEIDDIGANGRGGNGGVGIGGTDV